MVQVCAKRLWIRMDTAASVPGWLNIGSFSAASWSFQVNARFQCFSSSTYFPPHHSEADVEFFKLYIFIPTPWRASPSGEFFLLFSPEPQTAFPTNDKYARRIQDLDTDSKTENCLLHKRQMYPEDLRFWRCSYSFSSTDKCAPQQGSEWKMCATKKKSDGKGEVQLQS